MEGMRIACPHCDWEPDGGKHWYCACGALYNAFETAARCPKCTQQYERVQCMPPDRGGCHRESPYLDWYRGLQDTLEAALDIDEVAVTLD